MLRVFKFNVVRSLNVPNPGEESNPKEAQSDGGLGTPPGDLKLRNGMTVNMGPMLMRNQWNIEIRGRLRKHTNPLYRVSFRVSNSTKIAFQECVIPQPRFRSSWDKGRGIRTLLFADVNMDQCVYAMIQDVSLKGWGTVLLKDGRGTISQQYTSKMSAYNCGKSWGFVSTCEQVAYGVGQVVEGGP